MNLHHYGWMYIIMARKFTINRLACIIFWSCLKCEFLEFQVLESGEKN